METLAVVEFAVKINGLDADVRAVEDTKELSEDTTGSVGRLRGAAPPGCSVFLHTRIVWRMRGT